MLSLIAYIIFTIIFTVLTIYFCNLVKNEILLHLSFLIVILGLIYDAAVVSFGTAIGESNLLYALNFGRFIIHAVVTPLLLHAGVLLLNSYRRNCNKKTIPNYVLWLLVVVLIVFGVVTHLIGIVLEPRYFDGILFYHIGGEHKCFPYASIAVVLFYIGMGIDILRNSKKKDWSILTGSIIMFILCALPSSKFGIAPGSLGEVILIASIIFSFQQNYKLRE